MIYTQHATERRCNMLTEKSCEEFVSLLASSAPVPGGGGAAAAAGALAAALCSMAARLTADKPSFAQHRPEIDDIIRKSDELRIQLLRLIQDDADGFIPLSKAYSIPAGTPGREETLARASLDACTAPHTMLCCCADIAALLIRMKDICSKLMLSDVGCAAALCGGAMKAAAMNVYVNTRSLSGCARAEALTRDTDMKLNEGLNDTDAVCAFVTARLKG